MNKQPVFYIFCCFFYSFFWVNGYFVIAESVCMDLSKQGRSCAAVSASVDSSVQRELTVSFLSKMPDLNPHTAFTADDSQLLTALYEGLCVYDPYTLQPVPGLAENWRVSADGLIWTFTLRSGIVFENGEPITAQTFYDSFIHLVSPSLQLPYASLLDIVKGIKAYRTGNIGTVLDANSVGLRVVAPDTLQIELVRPAGHLPEILCHHAFAAVHSSFYSGAGSFVKEAGVLQVPVASGPFKVSRITDTAIYMIKNPSYWDSAAVCLPAVTVLRETNPDAIANAFNKGDVQWISGSAGLKNIADSHTIHITPMFATEYLYFKTDNAPCTTVAVRKKLLAAVPYDELRKDFLIPAATLVFPFAGYPSCDGIGKNTQSAAGTTDKTHSTDSVPEAAVANQKELALLLPESSVYTHIAQTLTAAWEKEGYTVTTAYVPAPQYAAALKKSDYHVGVLSWIGDFADPLAFLELFRKDTYFNYTAWHGKASELYENTILKAESEQDRQKRLALLAKAEQQLLDSGIIIPLSYIPAVNIIDLREIAGWYANPINIHPFKYIRFMPPKALPDVAEAF